MAEMRESTFDFTMKVEIYTEKEGQERIELHEKYLANAALGFVMYCSDKGDFIYNYMKDDTDGRYHQVDYLVWKFKECEGTNIMNVEERKEEAFRDFITFAIWAIEAEVDAMDRHFTDSVIELLKIPQLSVWHKDIRTVWDNYVELIGRLGFVFEDMGFLKVFDDKEYDYHTYYKEQRRKIFDKDPSGYDYDLYYSNKIEECLRKGTIYPNIDE